jgi:hypothetical protein
MALALLSGCIKIGEVSERVSGPPSTTEVLRWRDLPVTYCLDLDAEGYVSASGFTELVERAFASWGVPAESEGRCDGPARDDDERNQIGWGTPPARSAGPSRAYEAGYTSLRFRGCSRNCTPDSPSELLEADITIDPEPPRNLRNQRCLYSVVLHEVGHFLGVPHLAPPAIMAAVTTSCRQELTQADRSSLSESYDLAQR